MSRENVEVVRRAFEAYVPGDVEAMLGELDQRVEWKQFEEPVPVYGRDGVREAVRRWDETWHHPEADQDHHELSGVDVFLGLDLAEALEAVGLRE